MIAKTYGIFVVSEYLSSKSEEDTNVN